MAVGESGISTMSRAIVCRASAEHQSRPRPRHSISFICAEVWPHFLRCSSAYSSIDALWVLLCRSFIVAKKSIEVKTACNSIAILPDGAAASSSKFDINASQRPLQVLCYTCMKATSTSRARQSKTSMKEPVQMLRSRALIDATVLGVHRVSSRRRDTIISTATR